MGKSHEWTVLASVQPTLLPDAAHARQLLFKIVRTRLPRSRIRSEAEHPFNEHHSTGPCRLPHTWYIGYTGDKACRALPHEALDMHLHLRLGFGFVFSGNLCC